LAHQIEPSKEGHCGRGVLAQGGHLVQVMLVAVFSEYVQEALEDIKVHIRIRIRMFIYLSLAFIRQHGYSDSSFVFLDAVLFLINFDERKRAA
jgi:hypothetical protein